MADDIEWSDETDMGRHNAGDIVLSHCPMVARIGIYDIRWDSSFPSYTVVGPEQADPHHVNFTEYEIEGDQITPADDDVVLDPYHMCLLYTIHAAYYARRITNQGEA